MPRTLLYHDVFTSDSESSGFPGAGAARYKLPAGEFEAHIAAISAVLPNPESRRDIAISFDDGGISSLHPIADILERYGWRGYFFITTDFIGAPTFLSAEQIRELDARGHYIGSHSCSHPTRMAACTEEQLLHEWQQSCQRLSEILGHTITLASVPGGYYAPHVATTAAKMGIKTLYNSEPTTSTEMLDGCTILGRYTVYDGMTAAQATALAKGTSSALLQQAVMWKLKKLAKAIGGETYLRFRKSLLSQKYK